MRPCRACNDVSVLCVHDHLFKVASFTVRIAPIAWPIAKLLDFVLGADTEHTYKKAELKSFLQFHRTGEEPLRDAEIAILNGVLELNSKNVEEIMTPLEVGALPALTIDSTYPFLQDTVVLSANTILDPEMVNKLCGNPDLRQYRY